MTEPFGQGISTCHLMGLEVARVTSADLVDTIFARLTAGEGGWVITANLDFLRRWAKEPKMRALYAAADLRVADGMPLVWAARVQGDHLPERVAGSALALSLAERASVTGHSVYLLGGQGQAAARAAEVLQSRYPGLVVAGTANPMVHSPPSDEEINELLAMLQPLQPRILMVGLGSPKQEELIQRLRPHLPATFMIGVGVSFSFIAGDLQRAPGWMQTFGLEWMHRMAQEPGRLAKRYLVDDLPFVGSLFLHALRSRRRRGGVACP